MALVFPHGSKTPARLLAKVPPLSCKSWVSVPVQVRSLKVLLPCLPPSLPTPKTAPGLESLPGFPVTTETVLLPRPGPVTTAQPTTTAPEAPSQGTRTVNGSDLATAAVTESMTGTGTVIGTAEWTTIATGTTGATTALAPSTTGRPRTAATRIGLVRLVLWIRTSLVPTNLSRSPGLTGTSWKSARLYGPLWMALRRYRPPRETALRLVSEVTVLTLHFPERRDEQVQTRLHLLPLLLVTARLKTVAYHPRL